jgi:hypothetical protein
MQMIAMADSAMNAKPPMVAPMMTKLEDELSVLLLPPGRSSTSTPLRDTLLLPLVGEGDKKNIMGLELLVGESEPEVLRKEDTCALLETEDRLPIDGEAGMLLRRDVEGLNEEDGVTLLKDATGGMLEAGVRLLGAKVAEDDAVPLYIVCEDPRG